MIAIVNVGPTTKDLGGVRNYEVRINHEIITTFKHTRSDGLARCLELAAQAVRNKNLKEYMEALK